MKLNSAIDVEPPRSWSQCPAVESIPGKVSGARVFKGTRTSVAVVFENLEDGMTVDERSRSTPHPDTWSRSLSLRVFGLLHTVGLVSEVEFFAIGREKEYVIGLPLIRGRRFVVFVRAGARLWINDPIFITSSTRTICPSAR